MEISQTPVIPPTPAFSIDHMYLGVLSVLESSDFLALLIIFSHAGLHCVYRSRKNGYKRQRSQRIYPFKKRKFFRYSSLSNCDGGTGCKSAYNSSDMSIGKSSTCFGAAGHGGVRSCLCAV